MMGDNTESGNGDIKVGKTDGPPVDQYESAFKRETSALNLRRQSVEQSMLFYTEKARQLSRNKYNLQIILTGGPKGKFASSSSKGSDSARSSQDDTDYTFPNFRNRMVKATSLDANLHEPDILSLYIGKTDDSEDQNSNDLMQSGNWSDVPYFSRSMSHGRENQKLSFPSGRFVLPSMPYMPSKATRGQIELKAAPAVIHSRDPNIDTLQEANSFSRRSLFSDRSIKPRPGSRSLDRQYSRERRKYTPRSLQPLAGAQDLEFHSQSKDQFYVITGKGVQGEDKGHTANPIQTVQKANKKLGKPKKVKVSKYPEANGSGVVKQTLRNERKEGAWAQSSNVTVPVTEEESNSSEQDR